MDAIKGPLEGCHHGVENAPIAHVKSKQQLYNLLHSHYKKVIANVKPVVNWKQLKVVYLA